MNNENKKSAISFNTAFDILAKAVNKQLFNGLRSPCLLMPGMYYFGDSDILTFSEMIFILEKGIAYDKYRRWHNADLSREIPNHSQWFNQYLKRKKYEEERAVS